MFSTLCAFLTIAFAVPAGESAPMGFIAIHSGSMVHFRGASLSSDGHISLNGETTAVFDLNEDTSMLVNGKSLQLFEGFPIVKDDGTSGAAWGIDGGHLTFAGSDSFTVCQGNNNNIAFSGHGVPSNCVDPIGIVLQSVPLSSN